MTSASASSTPELPCEDLTERPRDWRSQFARPHGALGLLAGWLMARKNAAMNAACVDWLAPTARERVLEVGFGHGRTVEWLATRAGSVAGVDPSDTMLRQAGARNRRAIEAGRVRLARGEARSLPFESASFDAALAANCIQFWGDVPGALAELRRVLVPGGRLLVGIRVHDPDGGRFASPGFTEPQIEAVRAALERAGFAPVARVEREAGRRVVGLLGRRA